MELLTKYGAKLDAPEGRADSAPNVAETETVPDERLRCTALHEAVAEGI